MATTYWIGEHGYTPRQAAVLAQLAHGPVIVDELTKYDRNALDKLEELDLATIGAEQATITNAGRKVMVALNEKVNGKPAETKPPAAETKPAKAETPAAPRETKAPARETPPPRHGIDFARLRAEIVARYEADLAALDRLSEIARAVGA